MSRKKRMGWLRSPAILFVVFVTVLGLSGLVYAFWFTSLTSEGYVNTGNVLMTWGDMGTDDDGWLDNDPSGTDCDDEGADLFTTEPPSPCPTEIWDMWEPWQSQDNPYEFDPGSSADPSSPFAETRYDKDVARCDVGHDWGRDGEGSGNLVTWIENAYPSYYCTTYATAYNEGSIPVKATGLTMFFEKGYEECQAFLDDDMNEPFDGDFTDSGEGPFADLDGDGVRDDNEPYEWDMYWGNCEFNGTPMDIDIDENGYFEVGGATVHGEWEPELNGEIAAGILCGDQIDPGQGVQTSGWIHVNNAADQNMTYRWSLEQNFVNWNEWDDSMCTYQFEDPS